MVDVGLDKNTSCTYLIHLPSIPVLSTRCTVIKFSPWPVSWQICMLPSDCADQFPKTLFIDDLVQRDSVLLGRHQMVSCAVKNPSVEQRQNLMLMASMKFTGLVQLQHCELTICPVVDVSGDIKIIGFLISK